MLSLGIDEAGRGPVIGPLVVAGVVADEDTKQRFENLGVTDSKLLSPVKRGDLFDRIMALANKEMIISVFPAEIDEALRSPNSNLNWLEAQQQAKMINELKPDRVVIDAPSNNIDAYRDFLNNLLTWKPKELVIEHKADLHHVEVAAGSILAKVTRDREIETIKKQIGKNFGSGYSSDPYTREFLKKHAADYPDIFRKEWQTYKDAIAPKTQSTLEDWNARRRN